MEKSDLASALDATLSVATAGREAAAVPARSLIRAGDEQVVLVQAGSAPAGDIVLEQRWVALGVRREDLFEVRAGLKTGETIVVDGAAGLMR